ncbi:hypothetical protein EXM22_01775 [Oceanispirochaeta crateris]|uniref:PIN domain-containing protein n=1 Tax=Oceanispirochaeta crateris TaxID=2518645 RepID=A0A5C1QIE1_9SPIO|nr:hypothetical protein [Oceanispirochaeta crateris]QEN06780.1 hypothetical protein EXM22_01775 [Oceanispirochaeta crateris]
MIYFLQSIGSATLLPMPGLSAQATKASKLDVIHIQGVRMINDAKIVLFDTSNWIKILDNDNEIQNIFKKLIKKNIIPYITIENLMEIFTTENHIHPDFEIRLEKLYQVEIFASICSGTEILFSGIDDLFSKEVEAISKGLHNFVDIKTYVFENVEFKKFPILSKKEKSLLKQRVIDLRMKTKFASALNSYATNPLYNKKLKDIKNTNLDFDQEFNLEKVHKGNKVYLNNKKVANNYIENFNNDFSEIIKANKIHYNGKINIIDYIKIMTGNNKIDLNKKYKDYIIKKEYKDIIGKYSSSPLTNEYYKNTYSIDTYLKIKDKYQQVLNSDKPRKLELSSFTDFLFCSYSNYFNVVVDKRTKELLKQIERHTKMDYLLLDENDINEIICE